METFAEAIKAGQGVFAQAKGALSSLPSAGDRSGKTATVEGALKEQEERYLHPLPALKQPKAKPKSGSTPSETVHRGYRIGVADYTAPFWNLVEVSFVEPGKRAGGGTVWRLAALRWVLPSIDWFAISSIDAWILADSAHAPCVAGGVA